MNIKRNLMLLILFVWGGSFLSSQELASLNIDTNRLPRKLIVSLECDVNMSNVSLSGVCARWEPDKYGVASNPAYRCWYEDEEGNWISGKVARHGNDLVSFELVFETKENGRGVRLEDALNNKVIAELRFPIYKTGGSVAYRLDGKAKDDLVFYFPVGSSGTGMSWSRDAQVWETLPSDLVRCPVGNIWSKCDHAVFYCEASWFIGLTHFSQRFAVYPDHRLESAPPSTAILPSINQDLVNQINAELRLKKYREAHPQLYGDHPTTKH